MLSESGRLGQGREKKAMLRVSGAAMAVWATRMHPCLRERRIAKKRDFRTRPRPGPWKDTDTRSD